jgi:non-specific protein-tyrosine kinase
MPWDALAYQISANVIPNTQLLEIRVMDNDPVRAKVIAEAIAQQLILHSPTTPSNIDQEQMTFTKDQLADLENKIETARVETSNLQEQLDNANSSRLIQDLQNQINILESKIGNWQDTYSQLLASIQGGNINALSVIEEASIPSVPIGPDVTGNVLLASVIGLVLAVGGAFLIEYVEDTVKDPDDVSRTTNLPTIGSLPAIKGQTNSEKLIAVSQPLSPVVEGFRALRTNLQYSAVDKPIQSIMVTSPGPGEGKSLLVANLAVVLAQSDLSVILIDADLRRPVLHKFFQLKNRAGLSNALLSSNDKDSRFLQETNVPNLYLLSSGGLPPNPAEMLGSERMRTLIEELKTKGDILLFDSPPSLPVADAAILSTQLDIVIMVADTRRTRRKDLRTAVEELNRIHAHVFGVVLNHYKRNKAYYYYRGPTKVKISPNGKVPVKAASSGQPIPSVPDHPES